MQDVVLGGCAVTFPAHYHAAEPSIILFWLGSPHAQHLASTPLDILIIVDVLGRYLVTYRVHALRLEMMHWREEAFRLRANTDKSHED
eukprot:COSAG01_NODE_11406_length_1942_cov_3.136734_3_plen_88_part_00